MGTIVSGGRIWHSHRHGAACMGVVGKMVQGFWLEARGGGGNRIIIGLICYAPVSPQP